MVVPPVGVVQYRTNGMVPYHSSSVLFPLKRNAAFGGKK